MRAEGLISIPRFLGVDVNTLLYQVPGGMLSNLITPAQRMQRAEDQLIEVLEEVPRVRKDFGYPPLGYADQPDCRHAGRS